MLIVECFCSLYLVLRGTAQRARLSFIVKQIICKYLRRSIGFHYPPAEATPSLVWNYNFTWEEKSTSQMEMFKSGFILPFTQPAQPSPAKIQWFNHKWFDIHHWNTIFLLHHGWIFFQKILILFCHNVLFQNSSYFLIFSTILSKKLQ